MKIEATAKPKGPAKYLLLLMNRMGLFTLDIDITISDDDEKPQPQEKP